MPLSRERVAGHVLSITRELNNVSFASHREPTKSSPCSGVVPCGWSACALGALFFLLSLGESSASRPQREGP